MIKILIKKYPAIGQFLRFAVIGFMNTGVDLIILNLLMFATDLKQGTPYAVFKATSFIAAATFSFFMNKHWAFRDRSRTKQAKKFSQFFAVSVIGALVNVGTASLVVNIIAPAFDHKIIIDLSPQLWGNVGALCGSAMGLVWNFLGYKFIVFKK